MEGMGTRKARESAFPDPYRSVTESSPLPVAVAEGATGILRYANPAFCRLVGRSRQGAIGSLFFTMAPDGDQLRDIFTRVHQTKQPVAHVGNEQGGAPDRHWSYAMWPVFSDKAAPCDDIIIQVTATTPLHHQVTAMNQALMVRSVRQHELAEAANILNEQLQVEMIDRNRLEGLLRRENRDLEEFSSVASHDLQEPLRTIELYIQALTMKLGSGLDSETELLLKFIGEGSNRMRALIVDLLAYAELGAERPTAQPVECGDALEGALANLKGAIEETHASIGYDALPRLNSNLAELTRLFENLIGNALKYVKSGVAPEIHIRADLHEGAWIISVRDNGIGFNSQYADKIFRVFQRLHSREYPGTGIGLAICKRIVEAHNGRIWATGEEGHGATFFFTIPALGPDSPAGSFQ
jgi:signal transduction histidine kinase